VPDPASAPAGTGASAGGIGGVAGAAGPAEGATGAQESAALGSDRSEIGQQAPLLDYGVGLQQAIETLHGTIQLAARQGLSQARIALEPEGLGEIRIHLTQTAQGLLARVSAETPIAAQALAAAHAELRQSLSSLGLNLARLHIGRHDQSATQDGGTALGGGGHNGAAGRGEASSRGSRSGQAAGSATSTDSPTESEEDAQPAPAPSHGTLVDVLA
jgi:flagellar hook-length control protein FliK